MAESLMDRTTSGFPLSISTALAFESLFPPRTPVYDEARVKPEPIALGSYATLWVNVDTLFRNLIQSATKNMIANTGHLECAYILSEELDTIINLLNNEGHGRTAPVFYHLDYEVALRDRNKAIDLRVPTTPAQIHIETLRKRTIDELIKNRDDIVTFKKELRPKGLPTSALVLTHYPYDLLSKRNFIKMDLLESNTGKLKTPLKWNSKYYPLPGKDMNIFPFYRFLLMSLGDKALIKPQSSKLRNQIYESASKRNWTPATTMDKCMLDLSLDLHPFDYGVIRAF